MDEDRVEGLKEKVTESIKAMQAEGAGTKAAGAAQDTAGGAKDTVRDAMKR